jgi:hypothetical protein
MAKRVIQYAAAFVMWVISSVLGAVAMVQLYEATRVVAALAIPIDPMQEVMSRKQVLLVSRVALVLLAFVWIAAVIWLLVRYLRALEGSRRLWRVFAGTTVVELILLGVAVAVLYLLPGLALGGGV